MINRFYLRVFFIALGVVCLIASKLFASSFDMYGASSRAAATSDLGTIDRADSSFIYTNPAFLTAVRAFSVELGWFRASDFFEPIQGIVTQNSLSGKSTSVGNVQTNYPDLSGVTFGFLIPGRMSLPKISFGLKGFLPVGSLASIRTLEQYVPVYNQYHQRTKRFSFVASAAMEPIEHFSVGIAANLYLKSGANTKINLNESNSSVSMAMDIVPAISPIVGLKYQWNALGIDAAYHEPLDYAMMLNNKTEMPLFRANNADASIPIVEFLAQTSMFYDPRIVRLGISYLIANRYLVGVEGLWKNWKKYQLPINQVTFINPGEIQSKLPLVEFKDVISPGVGLEFPVGSVTLRGGYRFEPNHIQNQETNSNVVDTNVHVFSSGLGYRLKSLFGFFQEGVDVNAHLQYHYLESKQVVKSDMNTVGYKKDGYRVGGSLLNYGLSLQVTF